MRAAGRSIVALVIPLVPLAILGTMSDADAQTLVKTAVSGGAVDATGGGLRLQATVGEAGVVGRTAGGGLILGEGFWPGYWRMIATDVRFPADSGIQYVNTLRQNFPNPFVEATDIGFSVASRSTVKLDVYDIGGRRVTTLVDDEPYEPGIHRVSWDGRDLLGQQAASGVYFYRLHVGEWTATHKMLKLR